jgi:hypothetical protein
MTFAQLVGKFIDIINPILVLLVAVAMLVFFKGLVSFIAKSGDEKSHADGRNLMVWGLIALFVMISVFGILRMAYGEFGFNQPFKFPPTLPVNK